MQVAILAGGLATRLGNQIGERPKSMVTIGGKPFLEYQLEMLKKNGIQDIVLCLGHLGKQIQAYFGDGSKFEMNVSYSFEDKLLGTAGALKKAEGLLSDVFFTLYGDSYLFLDFQSAMSFFLRQNKLALMTVYKNYDQYDASNTAVDGNVVKQYSKKEKSPDMVYIEYGANIFKKEVLNIVPENRFYSLDELFPRLIEMGELLAFKVKERFYEIGSPQGLKELEEYIRGAK